MNKRAIIATTITIGAFETFIWGMSFLVLPGYEVMGGITLHVLILGSVTIAWLISRLWDWADN